jgi:hypothetical protein
MNYCKHCGKEVESGSDVCLSCGRSLQTQPQASAQDSGSFGWAVLGFFIPIIGLILYLVWNKERPKDAGMAGKGALASVILSVVAVVCSVIVAAL